MSFYLGSKKLHNTVSIIYVISLSELNTADRPPKHLELSSVTEVGARRVLLLQKKPRLTPPSPPTNKDAFDTTSPVHLPISWLSVYKTGTGTWRRGHWDACVGTCDLRTGDEGLGDIKYGTCERRGSEGP